MDYTKFKYYKGEKECPFEYDKTKKNWRDLLPVSPKAYWWFAEKMASEILPNNEPLAIQWLFNKWLDAGSLQPEYEKSYETGEAPKFD